MQTEERRRRISDYLRQSEFASLEELSRQVEASISTVRRDLIALAANDGSGISRTHGGARLTAPAKIDDYAFAVHRTQESDEKERMAFACASRVERRQTLILDAGSTVFRVAAHLEKMEPQIFTNSLPVANLFASSSQAEVILSGGVIYPRLGVLVGPLAERAFSEIHVDLAVMGGSGITAEGIYNSHALLIGIQRTMIAAARKVVFCLDHSKFGHKSMARVCGLDEVDCIITDQRAPADLVAAIRRQGVEVILAEETGPQE